MENQKGTWPYRAKCKGDIYSYGSSYKTYSIPLGRHAESLAVLPNADNVRKPRTPINQQTHAQSHTVLIRCEFFSEELDLIIPLPPYTPDLVPFGFGHFNKLKRSYFRFA